MNVRKILLWPAILIAVLIIAFVVVVNFSQTETALRCEGEYTSEGHSSPMTLYLALREYRWWVGLWTDSNGNLTVEIHPLGDFRYYDSLKKLGGTDAWQIWIRFGQDAKLLGQYNGLSKTITLRIPPGSFEGACTATT